MTDWLCKDCNTRWTGPIPSECPKCHPIEPPLDAAKRRLSVLKLYEDAADRAFQGRNALLPDFLRLGSCKAEGIVKLAEAYINLRERHAVERDAHARAAALAEAAEYEITRLRRAWIDARQCIRAMREHVQEQRNLSGFVQYACNPSRLYALLAAYDQRNHDRNSPPPADADSDDVCPGCGTPWGMRHAETCKNAAHPPRAKPIDANPEGPQG